MLDTTYFILHSFTTRNVKTEEVNQFNQVRTLIGGFILLGILKAPLNSVENPPQTYLHTVGQTQSGSCSIELRLGGLSVVPPVKAPWPSTLW